jgi:hypothetical protein
MVGKVGDFQIIVNLLVTNVPRVTGSNAKTLGMKYIHFPYIGASDGPPDGASIVHHGTDELLIEQNSIPDGETASPFWERSQHSQYVCHFLSHLIDMCRPGESFITGHPKVTGGIDPLDLFPEELNWRGFQDMPTSLSEEHRRAL